MNTYTMGVSKEHEVTILSVVLCEQTRGNSHTKMDEKFHLTITEVFLLWEWLNTGTDFMRDCGVSVLGDIQNPSAQRSWAAYSSWPTIEQEVRLDYVLEPFPTSTIFSFHDFFPLVSYFSRRWGYVSPLRKHCGELTDQFTGALSKLQVIVSHICLSFFFKFHLWARKARALNVDKLSCNFCD